MLTFHRWPSGLLLASLSWTLPALAAGPAPAAAPSQALAPLKVLLLPSEIKIYTISLGSIDENPDATAKMTAETDVALRQAVSGSPNFQLSVMPTLTADEQAALKEHVALYRLEAKDVQTLDDIGGDWKQVLENFDYSVGPGLRFLKQRTGADYGLVVFGGDGESTGANVLFGSMTGRNYLFAGLVDLETGNIVWLHHDTHDTANFTAKNNMDLFVAELLKDYPDGSLHDSSVSR